jgi:hypothetical protein
MRRTYEYVAVTKDEAQSRRWTSYEAVNLEASKNTSAIFVLCLKKNWKEVGALIVLLLRHQDLIYSCEIGLVGKQREEEGHGVSCIQYEIDIQNI